VSGKATLIPDLKRAVASWPSCQSERTAAIADGLWPSTGPAGRRVHPDWSTGDTGIAASRGTTLWMSSCKAMRSSGPVPDRHT
jgi:hypothetical protein